MVAVETNRHSTIWKFQSNFPNQPTELFDVFDLYFLPPGWFLFTSSSHVILSFHLSKVAKKGKRADLLQTQTMIICVFGTHSWEQNFPLRQSTVDKNFESLLWSLDFFFLRIQQLRKLFTEFVFWRGISVQTSFPYKTDKWRQPNQLKLTDLQTIQNSLKSPAW